MLGFRGASRYYSDRYREGFALECRAMKRVRDEMGLANVVPMIPFCRRVEEAEKVIAEMESNGLVRGENGLQVYVMCEIPNNILLIDEFSRYLRRVLHRLERSHPAHARDRPRLGRARRGVRRAGSRRREVRRDGRRGLPAEPPPQRPLRRGPERLPRVRGLPGRAGDRLDLGEPRRPAEDHPPRRRDRGADRSGKGGAGRTGPRRREAWGPRVGSLRQGRCRRADSGGHWLDVFLRLCTGRPGPGGPNRILRRGRPRPGRRSGRRRRAPSVRTRTPRPRRRPVRRALREARGRIRRGCSRM